MFFFSLFHHFFSATYQIKVSNVIYTSELYHCPRILFLSSSLWKTRSRRIESDICGVQSSYHMSFCITSTGQFQGDSQELQEFWRLWSLHKPHHPAAAQGLHWPLRGDDAKYTLAGSKVIIAWTVSSLTASVAVNHTRKKLLWWLMVT